MDPPKQRIDYVNQQKIAKMVHMLPTLIPPKVVIMWRLHPKMIPFEHIISVNL